MIDLQKISLAKPGEFTEIAVRDLQCVLKWTSNVDLDFIAYYKAKESVPEKKSIFKKLISSGTDSSEKSGKVYFGEKGSLNNHPFISLDKDAGIGDVGGDNKETLRFGNLESHEHILIVANIFGKNNANFSSYDGRVVLSTDTKEIEVPLTSNTGGNYCVIARIDNTTGVPRLINVNKTISGQPKIEDFI